MFGIAALVAQEMRRAVVEDIVGAFAEGFHLEVAATVTDKETGVDLFGKDAGAANLD